MGNLIRKLLVLKCLTKKIFKTYSIVERPEIKLILSGKKKLKTICAISAKIQSSAIGMSTSQHLNVELTM